jgi:hypothetical protein
MNVGAAAGCAVIVAFDARPARGFGPQGPRCGDAEDGYHGGPHPGP